MPYTLRMLGVGIILAIISLVCWTSADAGDPPIKVAPAGSKEELQQQIWANAPNMSANSLASTLDFPFFMFKVDAAPDRGLLIDYGPGQSRVTFPYANSIPGPTTDYATVLVALARHPVEADRYNLFAGIKSHFLERDRNKTWTNEKQIVELKVNEERFAHLKEGDEHWLMTFKCAGDEPPGDYRVTIKLVPVESEPEANNQNLQQP